jgi:hypothetical protein
VWFLAVVTLLILIPSYSMPYLNGRRGKKGKRDLTCSVQNL